MYSNIFWVIIFIISKHYVAGGFLAPLKKEVQSTYDETREDVENTETELMIDFKGLFCKDGEKYRSIDGTCNSKKCPGLGATGTPYQRLFKNNYCDGKEELTCSSTNDCLTSARVISKKLYKPKKKLDKFTTVSVAFGQFVVHDLALGLVGAQVTCCDQGKYTCDQETHPKCAAIDIPSCDPIYGPAGIRCLNFVRTDKDDCKPAKPLSGVTHYLDASGVYGSDDETARILRTGSGGKMRSVIRDGKEWPPQNMNPMEACFNLTCPDEPCYQTGVTHYLDASGVYGSDDETARILRTGSGGKMRSVIRDGKEWPPQNMNPMEACFNLTCPDEPCYQTGVTHYLDASGVYGSDDETARILRTGSGGKMRSVIRDGKEWPPQNMNPMEACFNLTCPDEPCYQTGDRRGNQNTLLTMIHILFLRFHNDLADKMCGKKKCPWDDEKCYQKVRRILIAVLQHITYNEYLTLVLGRDYMYKHKILYKKSCRDEYGYINDYSCDCDPSMSVESASAAFRGQHSAIPGFFKLYYENEEYCKNKSRCDDDYFDVSGSIELSAWMNKPSVIEKGDNSEGLCRSLFAQREECVDTHMDFQVQNLIFRADGLLGQDLPAQDIQRGRDYGVATFCTAALECGIISKCDCFDDLKDIIPDKYLRKLYKLYDGNVCDVELMVGGMVEPNVPGTLVGSVFRCILGKQFRYTRCGDAFWYESGDQVYPFTPEQLCNIRQIKMSYLICKYGDGIDKIQKHAFKKICKKNPLINCCDLPPLDYSLFKTY